MKVVANNGSPRSNGNTAFALNAVGEALEREGIDFEIIDIGAKYIHGCVACGQCGKNQDGKCSFTKDILNETLPKMREADGIILGSPGILFRHCGNDEKFYRSRVFCRIGKRWLVSTQSGGSGSGSTPQWRDNDF
ncbi:hypothetical protein AGMMS50229_20150 [Campylobacterota bacterium]|nr:hypothetical protein AGMMS50229_20150 [Campylobacterota bacterium]